MDPASITGIIQAIQAGASLLNATKSRKASKEVPALPEMLRALQGAQSYATAASDQSHPFFQNALKLRAENNLSELAQQLREVIRAQGRARAMGSPGILINPERRDEALASALARGLYQRNEEAKQLTSRDLLRTAQGLGGLAGQYGPAMNLQATYAQQEADRVAGLPLALGKVGQSIWDIFNPKKRTPGPLPRSDGYTGGYGDLSKLAVNYRRTF